MRRTEAPTWAPSLSSRSRSQVTLGASTGGPRRAQLLHRLGRGGEEDAVDAHDTAVRPIWSPSCSSLIRSVTAGTVDPLVNEPPLPPW